MQVAAGAYHTVTLGSDGAAYAAGAVADSSRVGAADTRDEHGSTLPSSAFAQSNTGVVWSMEEQSKLLVAVDRHRSKNWYVKFSLTHHPLSERQSRPRTKNKSVFSKVFLSPLSPLFGLGP